MDQHLKKVTHEKVKRILTNLEKNNMNGYFVPDTEALKALIQTLVPEKSTIAVGGSQTLTETGMLDWIRANDYHFYDRYAPGLTPQEIKAIHRQAFSVDAYFMSTNAITESGELYNVDGSGNRVAALAFGPEKVIVIAGINKIVKDIDDAKTRNREVAAPANSVRLNMGTPCTFTGSCSDCKSAGRICCTYSVVAYQRDKSRVHVILIDGDYGY